MQFLVMSGFLVAYSKTKRLLKKTKLFLSQTNYRTSYSILMKLGRDKKNSKDSSYLCSFSEKRLAIFSDDIKEKQKPKQRDFWKK